MHPADLKGRGSAMGVLEETRLGINVVASDGADRETVRIAPPDAPGPDPDEPEPTPPNTRCLGFTIQAQQQSLWCWLAVATSVERFFEPSSTLTQCQLANTMLTQTTCCTQPSSMACNRAGPTDNALQQVGHLESSVSGSMTFSQVKLEIGNEQDPIVVRIKWGSAAVGHAVVLSGYLTDSQGGQWLLVNDPSGGTTQLWANSEFRTAYRGNGTWDGTRRTKN